MNAVAALRTRSRSPLRCERKGMRPLSSSSSPTGSPSSVVARAGLTMLLRGLVGGRGRGVVLRDRAGRRLDQRADVVVGIVVANIGVGFAGELGQRDDVLRLLERRL